MTEGGNRGFDARVAQSVAPQSRIVYVGNDRCKPGCAHA